MNDPIVRNTHRLTHRYILAAGFIILIVFCGYLFLLMQFHRMQTDNDLFEAGYYRQRAISQRIAFLASELAIDPAAPNNGPVVGLLRESLAKLSTIHNQFTQKPTDHKIQELRAMYPDITMALNTSMTNFINAGERYLRTIEREDIAAINRNNPDLNFIIAEASGPLMHLLEEDVGLLRSHLEGDLRHFSLTLGILMGLILLALAAEIRFIFRPMAREIHDRMQQLDERRIEAEHADRMKSEFLATMSHEIRSPMSGVLGMAELLTQTNLTAAQRGYVSTIVNSGETLFRIIEDILDFSKLESDRLQLNPQPINMLDLIDDICALYAPKAREKALEIAAHYIPGSEQFVYADSGRMRQILGNLVNNAIKFTDAGHIAITVEEDRTHRDVAFTALLKFTVQDTGIGISQEFQHQAFEKFSQFDGSSSRSYGGMGLGLSVCRRLVEMMGGTITLHSTIGQGSSFSFTVPLKRNHSEMHINAKPPILENVRILAVDDLDCIRIVLKEQLDLAGARCDTAANGDQALEMMRDAKDSDNSYQMVLIDYLMPGMNGEALARAINDEPGLRSACLVMVTAAGASVNAENFKKGGFSALISKPLKNRVLIETLAIIWHRYQQGDIDSVIQVDDISLNEDGDGDHAIQVQGTHILLAEDSRVNQMFAQEILEQMGCHVSIAPNGEEALAALRADHYDLVLMDCQMPVMDGFEATRTIRASTDRPEFMNIPIIALTANAMEGDRERCLSVGMTDYISKPVRARELKEKVHYWIHASASSAIKRVAQPSTATTNDLIDLEAVSEARRVLKDKYSETLTRFIEDVTGYITEMETAVAANDVNGVVRAAHTVKSTSRLMGAVRLSGIAMDLEKTARLPEKASVSDVRTQLKALVTTFDETRAQLTKMSA